MQDTQTTNKKSIKDLFEKVNQQKHPATQRTTETPSDTTGTRKKSVEELFKTVKKKEDTMASSGTESSTDGVKTTGTTESQSKSYDSETFGAGIAEGLENIKNYFSGNIVDSWKKGRYNKAIQEEQAKLLKPIPSPFEIPAANIFGEELKETSSQEKVEKQIMRNAYDRGGMDALNQAREKIKGVRVNNYLDTYSVLYDKMSQLPESEARKKFNEAFANTDDDFAGAAKVFSEIATTPSLAGEMFTESLAQSPEAMLLGSLGAIGGPLGLAIGSFVGSRTSEEINSITAGMKAAGLDPSKKEDIERLLTDPELQDQIKQSVSDRADALATTEALFSLATFGISKFAPKSTVGRIIQTASGTATETGGEIAGEYVGSEAMKEGSGSLKESALEGAVGSAKSAIDVTLATKNILADRDINLTKKVDDAVGKVEEQVGIKDVSVEDATEEGRIDTDTDLDANETSELEVVQNSSPQEVSEDQTFEIENTTMQDIPVLDQNGNRVGSLKARPKTQENIFDGDGDVDVVDSDIYSPDIETRFLSDQEFGKAQAKERRKQREEAQEEAKKARKANKKAITKRVNKMADKIISSMNDKERKSSYAKKQAGKTGFLGTTNRLDVAFNDFLNDYARSLPSFVGELTAKMPSMRTALDQVITKPLARNILEQEEVVSNYEAEIQSLANQALKNNRELDSDKIGIYAFLNDKQDSKQESYDLMRASILNEFEDSRQTQKDQDNLRRKLEILEDVNENMSLALNEEEKQAYKAARSRFDQFAPRYKEAMQKGYGINIELTEDYAPRRVIGGVEKETSIDPQQAAEDAFNDANDSSTKAYESGRAKERRGSANVIYDTNFLRSTSRGLKEIINDSNLGDSMLEATAFLNNKEIKQTLGKENIEYLKEYINAYIRVSKSSFERGNEFIEAGLKAANEVKSGMLALPDQWFKQFVPALLQSVRYVDLAPKIANMIKNADDDWLRQYAPDLLLRKNNLSQIIESSVKMDGITRQGKVKISAYKRVINRMNNWFIQDGDYKAARLLFFAELARTGATLENVTPEQIATASMNQQRVAGINNIALAPKGYNAKSAAARFLVKTVGSFTLFPLNQSRQVFKSLANPTDSEQRMLGMLAMINLVGFAATSAALIEAKDVIYDLAFGEDDEEKERKEAKRPTEEIAGDHIRKIAIRSMADLIAANIPGAATMVNSAMEETNKKIKEEVLGEDYDRDIDRAVYTGFTPAIEERFGAPGSIITMTGNVAEAWWIYQRSGFDPSVGKYALAATAEASLYVQKYLPKALLDPVRRIKKQLKEDFKEIKKATSKGKKRRRTTTY